MPFIQGFSMGNENIPSMKKILADVLFGIVIPTLFQITYLFDLTKKMLL